MSISNVIGAIRGHKRFLISAHVDPEGDSVGSQLAIASLLKRLGKKAVIINEDPPPASCIFLPRTNSITLHKDLKGKGAGKFDCAVILDCPTIERIGKVKDLISEDMTVINIDHHVSNDMFGGVNWVDSGAAAVGEMIFELYKKLKLGLSCNEAKMIYSAILTDTGSFRYSSTSSRTHVIAAELVGKGLDMNAIYENFYELRSFQAAFLLGLVLSGIKKSGDGKIVWVWITKRMLKESGAAFDEAENFIGLPRSVKGCEAALLFKETEKRGIFKVSFRGKNKVDVNKIASKFGGGGHARAAGCTIKAAGPKEAEDLILREVSKAV